MPSVAENLISYWGIGAGSDPLRRKTQFVTAETGWPGFVRNYLELDIEAGIRRIMLWNPFGCEPANVTYDDPYRPGETYESIMPFDAWLRGSPIFKDEGFVPAIRELTKGGIEVIAYMGTLLGLSTWKQQKWNGDQWLMDCMEPFMEADCNLAFDTFCYAPDTSVEYQLMLRLKNMGVRVYSEAMPRAIGPHFERYRANEFPVVAIEADYVSSLSSGNQVPQINFGYIDPTTIEEEICLGMGWTGLTDGNTTWVEQYEESVPERIDEGHTCIIYSNHFRSAGGRLEDLIP